MKRLIIFSILALSAGFVSATTITITNSGFTFSPDNVTINFGDIVDFQIASMHNAVEVSEATWQANDNTPLPGGFALPFGGGQVTNLATGIHYYVCQPHASLGMKGKITVNAPQGINDPIVDAHLFSIYPNPTSGIFNLNFETSVHGGNPSANGDAEIRITDYLGREVIDLQGDNLQNDNSINLSVFPDGMYFIRVERDKKTFTRILVKKSGC